MGPGYFSHNSGTEPEIEIPALDSVICKAMKLCVVNYEIKQKLCLTV